MKRLTIILFAAACVFLAGCGKNVEKARIAFDKGVELLYNSSRFAEAEQYFTTAIKYDKDNHEAYYLRGCAKFNRGLYDAAIIDFEKALEVKPNYSDAEFVLGRTYFIKKDFDMSCYYYRLAELHGRPNMEDYVKTCD